MNGRFLSILVLHLLLSPNLFLFAQDKEKFVEWTEREIELANTAKDSKKLTKEEKRVIYLTNLCRINGKKFTLTYLKEYCQKNKLNHRKGNIASLIKDLQKVKMHPLIVLPELCDAATFHAKDMGETGQVGHNSSDGTNFSDRMKSFTGTIYGSGENCSYGLDKAENIIMQLLIDDGVPSLGHRKNILDKDYRSIGVSIQRHKTYKYNCVMDFSTSKKIKK
ncbi:MAG: hypothetical protein OHK0057_29690 [Thermoflexibacter sp.]